MIFCSGEGYQKNVVVYRCVNEIAASLGSLKWTLKDSNDEEIENHPLLDLLQRPNPMQGGAAFIQQMAMFKQITGNTYVHVITNGREPQELYVLNPANMSVIPGQLRIPKQYEYAYKGKESMERIIFPIDQITGESEVLHLRTTNPINEWYGLSPIEAAAWAIDLHNQAGEWNKQLLQNGARPSGAFSIEGKLTPEQRETLKESLKEEGKLLGTIFLNISKLDP